MAHINNKKLLGTALNTLVSVGAILWIVYTLDWSAVRSALAQAHYEWVIMGMLAVVINALIRTVRWGVLLPPWSSRFSSLFSALIIGQGANYILPARMGDVIRIYVVSEKLNISKAQALGTIALEKLWDTAMLVVFTLALSWFLPLPDWLLAPVRGTILVISTAFLIVAILLSRQTEIVSFFERIFIKWLPRFQQRFVLFAENVLTGFSGLQSVLRSIKISILSVLIWLLGGLTNYFVFLAFDIPLSYTVALILLLALILGVAVPSLPGRVGVFEAICVFVLKTFQIPESLAFSYALTMHITAMLPPLLIAIVLGSKYNLYRLRAINDDNP